MFDCFCKKEYLCIRMVFIFDISEKDTCSIELILQSLKDYFPASFKYFYNRVPALQPQFSKMVIHATCVKI